MNTEASAQKKQQNTKVIITCAVTEAIHTPSMSPYLPITPEEIIEASVGAAEAGAAIIHLHARDPITGRPDQRIVGILEAKRLGLQTKR